MESDKNWVHRQDSALNSATTTVLIAMVVIFAVLIVGAIFFLKGLGAA